VGQTEVTVGLVRQYRFRMTPIHAIRLGQFNIAVTRSDAMVVLVRIYEYLHDSDADIMMMMMTDEDGL